ncbi:alpha-L-fucosidase [Cohnella phaseoli]|uniref:alpha-L-fucosidase n=2 Tax=Cohnella phaseoli TaxID=456490 RepID=A0A3D9KN17_9BACL|nr:alpha-L-fucosidase [Cohnella phaseoli]
MNMSRSATPMSALLSIVICVSLLFGATAGPSPAAASDPNPARAFAFDEGQGGGAADSVSGVPHAISGTPVWVPGKIGQALDFDGQTTSVVMDAFDKTAFTMTAWIKPRSYAYNHFIVGQGVSGTQPDMFNWWVNDGKLFFLASDSAGNGFGLWPFSTADDSVPLDEWTHVAVSRSGSVFKLYVNGAPAASKSASGAIDLSGNPNPLRIGAQNTSAGEPMGVFDGAIDEFTIYSEALTDMQIAAIAAEGGGTLTETTYYVDSAAGNDANSGTVEEAPWRTLDKVNAATFQPGDRILLKAGSSWTGQLWPKGSGTAAKPIVVDRYGEGAKPAIHGAGLYQETVKLFNQQYWEINNLELTNVGEVRQTRRAVWIEAQDIGTASHIHLKNLDIHDVNGQTEVQDLESGGIIVRVTGSATPTKFDDVLIEGNTFTDVDSTGIFMRSNWRNRDTRTDGVGPWLGMTNLVIRGNSLNRTGGDAIIVCEGDAPLVEHNVAAHSYYDSVGYHAAIWAINSDDALFQYNEAYKTHNTLDGMAFDIDELCNNCVMQYNYSHDNEGGFMLLVGQRGEGTGYDRGGIVRYNVSENDGTALIQAVGRLDDYQVYNNTFYTGPESNARFLMAPDGNNLPEGTLSFRNNIIYNLGSNLTYYCGNATCTFDSNTYYGNHDPSEPADANKLTTDPGLVAPGFGSIGRTTTDGYKLAAGSPSLGSGTLIAGSGGQDYWGNAVSVSAAPNRGAYNGAGQQVTFIPKATIAVDGTLGDWAGLPDIDLNAQGQVEMPDYGGTEDLSGKIAFAWDDDYVYLSASVRDDVHHQPETGDGIWLGDSVQFAISPGAPGSSSSWYEFGMALTSAGPQLYRWSGIGHSGGFVTSGQLAIVRNEPAGETRYELALPWAELSPISAADGAFSLSLLVNDNDGSGRKGWIEWGGGIGGSKDSALFHPAALSGASASRSPAENAIALAGILGSGTLLSEGKSAIVSSVGNGNDGSRAFDGSLSTKWESQNADPQWLIADLGKPHLINRVKLVWDDNAYATSYKIRISDDLIHWTEAYSTTNGSGGTLDVSFADTEGRFVQMYGTKRSGATAYAVYEFEVYGEEIPYTPPAVAPLLPHLPVPTDSQLAYQKMETIAFAHFGMNTFTEREWGTGDEDPMTFNPTDFDARQWVSALKDAGFKLLILTAKHHDGFALWPSAYTTHDVASSPWKNGQGDVVKEVSDACQEFGIKFGLYLSPWDMHEPTYGTGEPYNDFFVNQLTELLTNYGEISEMWFDGAKGENTPQEYDTERWYSVIRQLQPNAIIWGMPGDARYIGNEDGIASATNWSKVIPQQPGNPYWSPNQYGEGFPNGTVWQSGEADVPLRPGWFYHDWEDSHIKSLSSLIDIYQQSVGRGANLLLNVSPDKRGKLPEADIARLMELREWIDDAYGANAAAGASAAASNTRGGAAVYSPANVVDTDYDSYWATDDNVTTGYVELDFGAEKSFDAVVLQEYIPLGQRIAGFQVQVWKNNAWETAATGTTVGYKRIVTFPAVAASKLRIQITSSQAAPALNFVGAYDIDAAGGGGSSVDQDREQYFSFDEGQGGSVTESVSGQTLTIQGGYSWVPGKVGQALAFNGWDTSIVTDSIVKQNFTFAAWIKPSSDGTNRLIVGQGESGSGINMFNWWIVDGRMEFLMSDELGQGHNLWPFATANQSIPLNEWTHVAVSKSGSEFKLYINGQLAVSKTASSAIPQPNNPNPFRIGGQNANGGAGEVFDGAIDELRMYPRTLTDQEIYALSQTGGQQPGQPINIALIGDSITTGSYPSQLQQLLGPDYYVNPYGAGGTTMLKNGDHPYWDSWEFVNSSNWDPDIVVIMLGTNDSAAQNWQYSADYVSDYLDMIDHYRGLPSSPVVYVATSPHDYWPGNVVTSEVVPLQIQAAASAGATVIHVNPQTQSMAHNFPDNVHPNDAGSTAIATTIYNALKPSSLPTLTQAFSRIEAESFSAKNGSVQAEPSSEGTDNLGFIGTEDYVVYENVNFGLGASVIDARIAGDSAVGKIEVRLDSPTGTLLGTVDGVNTGSYQTYTTVQTSLGAVTGVHNVYLVFTAGLNLNWFQFRQ